MNQPPPKEGVFAPPRTLTRRRFLQQLSVLLPIGALLPGCGLFGSPKTPPKPLPLANLLPFSWRYKLQGGAGYGFQPAALGSDVVAAARNGSVIRLNAQGQALWRVELETPLATGVGTSETFLAVGTIDGTLVCMDPQHGKVRWKTPLATGFWSIPAVTEKVVVIRLDENRLAAFDALTGQPRWNHGENHAKSSLTLQQNSLLAVDERCVYAGISGGRLVALSLETGEVAWETVVGQPRGANEIDRITEIVGAPVLRDGRLWVGMFQGRLSCLSAIDGRPIWSREFSTVSGVAADERMLVATDENGTVHAFSPSGDLLWQQTLLKSRLLSAPLLLRDSVMVGDNLGVLHLLSCQNGDYLATGILDETRAANALDRVVPVRVDGIVVIQTASGTLAGLPAVPSLQLMQRSR